MFRKTEIFLPAELDAIFAAPPRRANQSAFLVQSDGEEAGGLVRSACALAMHNTSSGCRLTACVQTRMCTLHRVAGRASRRPRSLPACNAGWQRDLSVFFNKVVGISLTREILQGAAIELSTDFPSTSGHPKAAVVRVSPCSPEKGHGRLASIVRGIIHGRAGGVGRL
jgi:hypothetical protein